MAADRPLSERGIVEIKMGRSKFPGKPSKIGNRKRVNLSSCSLPEDNDSSKAAKNIYLGLSVFNETFGDNEMVAPGPFHGFSMTEVEEAMAEARLQQKEAELEHKKQGITINLWNDFQTELFSITSCSTQESTPHHNGVEVNKTKLSFDGGGPSQGSGFTTNYYDNIDIWPSKISSKNIGNFKIKNIIHTPKKKIKNAVKFQLPQLKLNKLQCSPHSKRSLQSQAAKKLLEKAKMSNLTESIKNGSTEKKFLPNFSTSSSKIVKSHKRLNEDNTARQKCLRSAARLTKHSTCMNDPLMETLQNNNFTEAEVEEDTSNNNNKKKHLKSQESLIQKTNLHTNLTETVTNQSLTSSTGKIILREARLQLDKTNASLLEGPFSTPSASSLSPNSQLKVNAMQSVNVPGSITCGVCGVVRIYKFVEDAKKFGIYCCEFCAKFISNIIKSFDVKKDSKLQCLKGNGLCGINTVVKTNHFNAVGPVSQSKCQACWLKLCLKNFKMPINLKEKLLKLLPANIQVTFNLEFPKSKEVANKFIFNSRNIKDFKWLNQNSSVCSDKITDYRTMNWPNTSDSNEKSLRKRTRNVGNENSALLSSQTGKLKTEADDKGRQSVVLKGPRVKHVCRSASVVLGQPLAIFPSDSSPAKKQTNTVVEDCKSCDNIITTNTINEPQGIPKKSNISTEPMDTKPIGKEKKLGNSKDVTNSRALKSVQQSTVTKSKKKANTKVENPISMDFWESYDPDEICETGFGLIGSDTFSVRALCFLCGSSGRERLIHCASCCEPYHEFCVEESQLKLNDGSWKYDWVCPRCTVCFTCGKTSGQQLTCVKCDNSYHIECVDRVGGRLLHSPDRPWVCSVCLRCKSCNAVDVSMFVGNLPLCKPCFVLRQKGNYCPLCQRCYEDDDYDSKMMECGQCQCWVHAKCEGLSDEKYQVLSFLPESVEYVCRMCCVIPPAPWWLAVEAELKSGYLGVLKALSKNRKACTMLKWSPRKQCTCRQIGFVSRALDFEDSSKGNGGDSKVVNEESTAQVAEENVIVNGSAKEVKCQPANVSERKTSIEVINHPTESLKLTLKIMKGSDSDFKGKSDVTELIKNESRTSDAKEKCSDKENNTRIQKCRSSNGNGVDCLTRVLHSQNENQTSLHSSFQGTVSGITPKDLREKQSLSSSVNPPSDSGIISTDDELKTNNLADQKRMDEQTSGQIVESKLNCDTSVSFLEEKRECFCFLEVDTYNSRSKPFSPNLMAIKKKVTTSEYSSLQQFHQDMERMIATTDSPELMDMYHQTIKDIFPWFDPKFSRVQSSSQKVMGTMSLESTPVKNTPLKNTLQEECKISKEKLCGQSLDYYYSNYTVEDTRICLLCKSLGDGPPGDAGRLLYCGQNEWVHCNCALWSGEVFEEIDGSLQNVQSAISRGRSIKCPECNLKGASIGCCARNCQETYHFSCARKIGCIFMDDKTMYCPSHIRESNGKLVQNEKEFEIRRPIYVELDKRKMKSADSNDIRFTVGALQVNSLGRFVLKLSDQEDAIIPEQFSCTRLFWSCYEPWRIVRYHFTVRLDESQSNEGVDFGFNITVDHSLESEVLDLKLKQLSHFQKYNTFVDTNETNVEEGPKERLKINNVKPAENCSKNQIFGQAKNSIKDKKVARKIIEQFDSKDDENCLTDNQNTAALLPPDIEEAILKDLPHDILDGISMQDIFMDIKNDPFDGNATKDGTSDDQCEVEDNLENCSRKERKSEGDNNVQNEFWAEANSCRQNALEEPMVVSKSTKDLKRSKPEESPNQAVKKPTTLRTYQKSSHLSWNNKTDACNNKWKKNSKCHVTVNLLEPQERGNMLQELKFTDGLVTLSTGVIGSMKDLKSRLEDNKRVIQDEGKENKFLSWQARLQPRLLQVDGGVDSSSSGSEAGESPQRVIEENINSNRIATTEALHFLDCPIYSVPPTKYMKPESDTFKSGYPGISRDNTDISDRLPQLDGIGGGHSDASDSDDSIYLQLKGKQKRRRYDYAKPSKAETSITEFKINQCDGGVDSEYEEETLAKCTLGDELSCSVTPNRTDDEPVKCSKCHCTYRTKISYQRHLESCSNDFMLSSSEAEVSDEESPKKTLSAPQAPSSENVAPPATKNIEVGASVLRCTSTPVKNLCNGSLHNVNHKSSDKSEKSESAKKEKGAKKPYTRKKTIQNVKKLVTSNTVQQVQQIMVQQQSAAPAIIVQDVGASNANVNAIPSTYPASTMSYVAAVDAQNPFGKTHLIAAPNAIISGNLQFSSASETQLLGGICLNPQNVQANVPGFIIQPAHPATGALISSQSGPIMMSGEQMILGSSGLYDVVTDPRTGGLFLANYNQPVFYNMETIVSNTVTQTNQFVSNVLATSYSQTSTQIFQTSEMEQLVSLPSNYILVGTNPPATDRLISSDELICLPTQQGFLANQNPLQVANQSIFGPSIQPLQAFRAEPKIVSTQMSSVRCVQPIGPSVVVGKIAGANGTVISQPVTQIVQKPPFAASPSSPKIKAASPNKMPTVNNKSRNSGTLKPGGTAKSKIQSAQPRSRALVDYINNFKSDVCDTVSPSVAPSVADNKSDAAAVVVAAAASASCQNNSLSTTGIKTDPVQQPVIKSEATPNIVPALPPEFSLSGQGNVKNESEIPRPSLKLDDSLTSKPSTIAEEVAPLDTTAQLQPTTRTVTLPNATAKITSPIGKLPPTNGSSSNNNSNTETPKPLNELNAPESWSKCTHEKKPSQSIVKSENVKPASMRANVVESSKEPLTNKTNSFGFEQGVKKYLNMPNLDDDFSVPANAEPLKLTETSCKEKSGNQKTLPLQENMAAVNNVLKSHVQGVKSNVQGSEIWSSSNAPDGGGKCKRKLNSNDQNAVEPTLTSDKIGDLKEKNSSEKLNSDMKFTLTKKRSEEKGPKLVFDVTSEDGFRCSSTSMAELWANICDSVQEMRAAVKLPLLPVARKGYEILGMQNHGLQHCLEQLRGVEQCLKYKCKYFLRDESQRNEEDEVKENLSGCARTEQFAGRKEYDMFAWLASKHRELPKLTESAEETLSSIRRANNLPLAMKYRNLRETAKMYLGVYRSKIHGRGLFCLREIEAGEMVIEYAGEVIRSNLTDKREKYYTDKGIGCYMFRIDDHFVVDATMKGNAARFINHSCEPNCYSKVVDILGKKHIVIFALRRITIMEELTYDYKFPFEDEKISCHCLSKKCKKYLN